MLIDVLTALAVVAAVSLFLGILLAIFIKFFSIAENEKAKQIRQILPGINCGACGFTGCDSYAKALANGEAAPNLCIPGAESVAKELGELLGIEVEEPKDFVAFIGCNGNCDAASLKANYEGITSCKALSMLYGGTKGCNYGCLGCGDCQKVCVSDAINLSNGIAFVDTSKCVGCGLCVNECPKKLIKLVPQETRVAVYCNSKDKGADARKVCKNACIGCKKCEKTCEAGAISVINNCAVIDYSKCTGCQLCTKECPTECLKAVFFPDLPEGFILRK